MKLKALELKNFRVYKHLEYSCHPRLNIILGDNAQGKTSILESIHMLGITKSHKTLRDVEVIQSECEHAKIRGSLLLEDTPLELDVVISKNGKKAKYNRIEIKKLSEYVGYLNVVMFAPEDLDLIKGSPSERRRFMDLEIGKLKKSYITYLIQYRRILKERNEVLKGIQQKKKYNHTILEILTEQLIHYGEKIIQARIEFIEMLNDIVQEKYLNISGESITVNLTYTPSIKDNLKEAYAKRQRQDILFGNTQNGPHRDDFEITFEGIPIKTYASQGQIRSMVLAIKLAIVEMIYKEKAQYPIVLLDDVFSELDSSRQINLLDHLNPETQLFITTTDLNSIPMDKLSSYQITTISQGQIKGVIHDAKPKL